LPDVSSILELAMSISLPGISGTTGIFTKPSSASSSSSSAVPSSSGLTGQSDQGNSTVQQFLEYAKMTPAQRIFAQMLNKLGITEDQYKAMPPGRKAEGRTEGSGITVNSVAPGPAKSSVPSQHACGQ
jgi:hypothetical protein